MDQKTENNRIARSRIVVALRVGFALVSLGIVLYSIRFHDYLTDENKSPPLKILQADETHFLVEDPSGEVMQIRRDDADYRYQIGAISLVKNIRLLPTLAAMATFAVVPLLLSYRWQILLKVQGVQIPFRKVIQMTYAGLFLNFFLIGTTGGDLVKAYWVGRFAPKRAEGFVSVFVDRFIGLVVLIVMSALFVIVMWRDQQVAQLSRAVGVLVVLAAMAVCFLFSKRLRRLIRFDRWKQRLPISGLVDRIDRSLLAYRDSGAVLLKASLATVGLQFLGSTAAFFLGSALQIQADIWYYWLYVPLAFLIGSIPVSMFWGLGLLEGAYVAFFAGSKFAGVTQAAMLAMAVRLMQLIWALPGSAVLAVGVPRRSEADEPQVLLADQT